MLDLAFPVLNRLSSVELYLHVVKAVLLALFGVFLENAVEASLNHFVPHHLDLNVSLGGFLRSNCFLSCFFIVDHNYSLTDLFIQIKI